MNINKYIGTTSHNIYYVQLYWFTMLYCEAIGIY